MLTYGNLYQGGYIFALDDTTATSLSVGGTVVAPSGSPDATNIQSGAVTYCMSFTGSGLSGWVLPSICQMHFLISDCHKMEL